MYSPSNNDPVSAGRALTLARVVSGAEHPGEAVWVVRYHPAARAVVVDSAVVVSEPAGALAAAVNFVPAGDFNARNTKDEGLDYPQPKASLAL